MKPNTNLAEETYLFMKEHGKYALDVKWIGTPSGTCDYDTFYEMAEKVNYYKGHDIQRIARDLLIVFNDGSWMERWEYDGAEGWRFKKTPVNSSTEPLTNLLEETYGY